MSKAARRTIMLLMALGLAVSLTGWVAAQQPAAPGATATYTVSVVNNGVGCGAATFALQASLPPGWAGFSSRG